MGAANVRSGPAAADSALVATTALLVVWCRWGVAPEAMRRGVGREQHAGSAGPRATGRVRPPQTYETPIARRLMCWCVGVSTLKLNIVPQVYDWLVRVGKMGVYGACVCVSDPL